MTNIDIKNKIDENNKKIESLVTLGFFTLNKEIYELNLENSELQKKCSHNFIDGYCKYCYCEEGK